MRLRCSSRRDCSARSRACARPAPDYPLTLFYAFKQAETEANGGAVTSTGWDTMLTALLDAGFTITGTWPIRTERSGRSISIGTAALASFIVLVCRPRPDDAPLATRRELVGALRGELPKALRTLQQGNLAPVDLAQAAIGPDDARGTVSTSLPPPAWSPHRDQPVRLQRS